MKNVLKTIVSITITDSRFQSEDDRRICFGVSTPEFATGDRDFTGETVEAAMADAVAWHEANPQHANEVRELWVCRRVQFAEVASGKWKTAGKD